MFLILAPTQTASLKPGIHTRVSGCIYVFVLHFAIQTTLNYSANKQFPTPLHRMSNQFDKSDVLPPRHRLTIHNSIHIRLTNNLILSIYNLS